MTYCDTSFLASLYLKDDNHIPAVKLAGKFKQAIPYTLLAELELINASRRSAERKIINAQDLASTLSQIERDIADGFLVRTPINQSDQYKLAMDISKRRAGLLCRSLDILHVSTAVLVGAEVFASFDVRQKQLAEAEGLVVAPK